jgi:hypothetical protein
MTNRGEVEEAMAKRLPSAIALFNQSLEVNEHIGYAEGKAMTPSCHEPVKTGFGFKPEIDFQANMIHHSKSKGTIAGSSGS